MQIGALIAFLSYLIQILMSVMMATFMAMLVPRAAVCAERIQEVLDTAVVGAWPPPTRSTEAAPERHARAARRRVPLPGRRGPGARRHHRSRPDAGQTTAIIGSTGSGKTTLLNLVPRLFDATAGAVLVDGVDVRDLDPEVLWSRIGLVPQKPYLFSGTVASNLRYGDPDATDDELWAGARDRPGRPTS